MRNYKKSKRKGFSLEEYVARKLKDIDRYAKPTKNSGASGSIGDVSNRYFFVECKQRLTKDNIILQRSVWRKHINSLPINTHKLPIAVIENKHNERFVIMNIDDFFDIVYTSPTFNEGFGKE